MRFELLVLDELGFGLDLTRCAATGSRDELAYVSPKTGRAVSREAGAPWHDKMLALPAFLRRGETAGADRAALEEAFRLTGFFLTRHVYEPRAIAEPPEARASFLAALRKAMADPPKEMARPPHERSRVAAGRSRRPGSVPLPTRMARASAWPNLLVDRPCRASIARLELGPVSRHNHSKGQG